jgi:DNA-binding NtrC family response regulator
MKPEMTLLGPGPRKVRTSRLRLTLELAPLALVAERDPQLRRQLAAVLRRKGYRVRVHGRAVDLLNYLSATRGNLDTPAVAVLGVTAGERAALDSLGATGLGDGGSDVSVIIPEGISAFRAAAFSGGATRVIERPGAAAALVSAVPDAYQMEWAMED